MRGAGWLSRGNSGTLFSLSPRQDSGEVHRCCSADKSKLEEPTMKRKTVVAIAWFALICLASLLASNGQAEGGKGSKTDTATVEKELGALQGTWTFVSGEAGGKEVMGEDKNFFLVIRGDVGVLKIGKNVGQVCKIK